jgi:cytochrome c peroxidase
VYADPRAARLGQFLFYDARFSASGDVSCATCHDPARGFADGKHFGQARGPVLERHTPSLWIAAYNRWFFWDGRADSLWSQALKPLEEPREHGATRLGIAHALHADADLRRAYEELFGPLPPLDDAARFPPAGRPVPDAPDDPQARAWAGMEPADQAAVDLVFANTGKALAAYERLLVSRAAPFDAFVAGVRAGDLYQQLALSQEARGGLRLFVGKARCVLCHSGPNFTDREFHDNRVPPLKPGPRLDAARYDGIPLVQAVPFIGVGAFSDAPEGEARDKVGFLLRAGHNWSEFKTPTLRNAVLTAPYMHQGQLATLDDVLAYYNTLATAVPSHHQGERTLVPLDLGPQELSDLRAFLESLVDARIAPELLRQPPTPYLP